jgi:hypothetical protein
MIFFLGFVVCPAAKLIDIPRNSYDAGLVNPILPALRFNFFLRFIGYNPGEVF